jgi:hypothetical protein
MEQLPLTRVYLESLVTSDLIEMANDFGLDIPDNADRDFLIDELFEAASHDDEIMQPKKTGEVMMEAAPLPKNYNITFIDVMIRDPLWAFVFWEIKASDAEQYENALDFDGYYLKVTSLGDPESSSRSDEVFTVPVKAEDTAWYLSLPPAEGNLCAIQCLLKVEFCASLGGVETVLAVSAPIKLPGLNMLSSGACENQLVRLSGYDDFHILRRNERSPRIKRTENSNE